MNRKVIANWKMAAHLKQAEHLVTELKRALFYFDVDLTLCPSFVHIPLIQAKLKHNRDILYGAQDVSRHESGAHTGEVSASMLKELGCSEVIVGHSECRIDHHESVACISEKVQRLLESQLTPIICVGESLKERKEGLTETVLAAQIQPVLSKIQKNTPFMLAYEPIWAIGTGQAADLKEIERVNNFLKAQLRHHSAKLLYGGSVSAKNAFEILGTSGVDGVLVGGASLQVEDLIAICRAAHEHSLND